MRFTRRNNIALVAFACALGLASPANAEIVRVITGPNAFGQGWRFLDSDGVCKVVTARHVVVGEDGKFLRAQIQDAKKQLASVGEGAILSKEEAIDIAILPVPSENDPVVCGDGRLSDSGIERRAAATSGLVLESTGQTEVVAIPVERYASRMDAGRGELFAVRAQNPKDSFAKGWSGSVVVDSQGPVGIIFDVDPDRNEANAVRVDVVHRVMDQAKAAEAVAKVGGVSEPQRAAETAQPEKQASAQPASETNATAAPLGASDASILALVGTTTDVTHGPDQLLRADGAGWLVNPVRRTITFEFSYAKPTQVRTFQLAFDGGAAGALVSGFSLRVSPDEKGSNWVNVGYCPVKTGSNMITCSVVPTTVRRVQVVAGTKTDDPVLIQKWNAD